LELFSDPLHQFNPMPRKKQPYSRLQPGQRVVKKSNMTLIGNQISMQQRKLPNILHGEIIEIITIKNKRGSYHPYCKVRWDENGRVDLVLASRLHLEKDKDLMIASQVESIGA
jgi:hypothetical protein